MARRIQLLQTAGRGPAASARSIFSTGHSYNELNMKFFCIPRHSPVIVYIAKRTCAQPRCLHGKLQPVHGACACIFVASANAIMPAPCTVNLRYGRCHARVDGRDLLGSLTRSQQASSTVFMFSEMGSGCCRAVHSQRAVCSMCSDQPPAPRQLLHLECN